MPTTIDLKTLTTHPAITASLDAAKKTGGELYLVGGAVREMLMSGKLADDFDIAVVNASSKALATAVAEQLDGRMVVLDETWGIYRVVLPQSGLMLDFSDALENSIDKDLARRDLTINAIAIRLNDGTMLDPFDGQGDLQKRHIRMISEKNMLDDPLRLIRVFRFAAAIEANSIDAATLTCVETHKEKLLEAAGERIQYELFKLFNAPHGFEALKTMAECGLLEVVIPELKDTRNVPANGYHHLGLFEHTLELVKQSERLINELPAEAQEKINEPFNGVVTRFGLIKLACLLHDIGKPATMAEKEGVPGRLTFYGHDEVSEEMTEAVVKRLKMGNDTAGFVKKLVRWHLYPCHFSPTSSRKSVMKFFRRMGDDTPDVILLALADRHSTLGPEKTGEILEKEHNDHLWLLTRYYEELHTLKLPPLLTGHDVMQILGITPGPKIKEVLHALEEAHQLGEVRDSNTARTWIKQQFS